MPAFGTASVIRVNDKGMSTSRTQIATDNTTVGVAISGVRRISSTLMTTINLTQAFGVAGTNVDLTGFRANGALIPFTQFGGATSPSAGAFSFPAASSGQFWAETSDTALYDLSNLTVEWVAQTFAGANGSNSLYIAIGGVNTFGSVINNAYTSNFSIFNTVYSAMTVAIGDTFTIRSANSEADWLINNVEVRPTENITVTYSLITANGATLSNTTAQPLHSNFVDLDVRSATPNSTITVRATYNTGQTQDFSYLVSATPNVASVRTADMNDKEHRVETTGDVDVNVAIPTATQTTEHFFYNPLGTRNLRLLLTGATSNEGATISWGEAGEEVKLVWDIPNTVWKVTRLGGGTVTPPNVQTVTSSATALTLSNDVETRIIYADGATASASAQVVLPSAVGRTQAVRFVVSQTSGTNTGTVALSIVGGTEQMRNSFATPDMANSYTFSFNDSITLIPIEGVWTIF